ncbi:hypothetical protein KGA66_28910 [Actinocrinis puniceicyclus]|uniref:Uncharacterized protein n=1 Tax=Actinocrinis puniceicyclus TaxID=977794 RepID=A0A8J8BHR1_9ACTN|nr:hypothetical protein [Actinocrinis puniceicyclus]MBS2967089.1 hypothetical protein [Actinocrinis puniceicyclus]
MPFKGTRDGQGLLMDLADGLGYWIQVDDGWRMGVFRRRLTRRCAS